MTRATLEYGSGATTSDLWMANAPRTCGNLAILFMATCCALSLVGAGVVPIGLLPLELARSYDPEDDFVAIRECEVHGAEHAAAEQRYDECIDTFLYNFTTKVTSTSPPPPFYLPAAPAPVTHTSPPERKSRGPGSR